MKKRNYNYKSLIKQAFSYMTRALKDGYGLNKASQGIRTLVNSYSGLNRDEKYELWNTCYVLYRACRHDGDWTERISKRKNYDQVLRTARRVERKLKLRKQRNMTRTVLSGKDNIFFLCSVHSNCASDHKEYQGKMYVDRFWRTKVSGDRYYAVLSYIRNRKIMTVQQAMKDPIWLTTRPNCRHYFIPMDTDTVLHSSVNKLAAIHTSRLKKYTAEEYFDVRGKVFDRMYEIVPCKAFAKKRGV